MNEMKVIRETYLHQWANVIARQAAQGEYSKAPFYPRFSLVNGPRAGALLVDSGVNCGPMMRKLNQDQAAILRQTIPFDFVGEPISFMQGKRLRLECGWPLTLAETMVRLSDLAQVNKPDRWVVGKNEHGQTVTTSLSDQTPMFLYGGQSGSGKSVAMQNACLGLCGDNQLVLIDGKYKSSLGIAENLLGVVGPIATEIDDVKSALGWACAEMRLRYEQISQGLTPQGKLVVIFDEFQEYAEDSTISGLMRKIATQGRGAGVHMICATQHPTVDVFGNSATRRQLTGVLALTVKDQSASQVIVGNSEPRADLLLGAGDGYAIAPGVCHRIQCAYVDSKDFDKAEKGGWLVDEWPTYDAETIGQDLPATSSQPTNLELSLSILSAAAGEGRTKFLARCKTAGLDIGSTKGRKLLSQGKELWEMIQDSDEIKAFCKGVNNV